MSAISRVTGRAISIPGNDIDTDRIMPARFLKVITFEGLERHLFDDDRRERSARGEMHPLDDPARAGATVLLVNANFGCGSSREHAPQAIWRWGIRAIVGESFAEIFAGNALMLGLPCATASRRDIEALMDRASRDPQSTFDLDLTNRTVVAGPLDVPITMPASTREALLSGQWDATGLLLDRYDDVERVAAALPYSTGFERRV
jgi:3-isopropylmalate/(R)-2-methylmalate dehydratase small subunit